MSELTVFIRGYAVDVNVTRAFVQKPLGRMADSDADCYGYSELDYDVIAVINEHGDAMQEIAANSWAEANHAEIVENIWHELERQS